MKVKSLFSQIVAMTALPLFLFILFTLLSSLKLVDSIISYVAAPTAREGLLYCSNIDTKAPTMLRGEWEYYENSFLFPSDFSYEKGSRVQTTPSIIHIPGSVPDHHNYGTYRLRFAFSSIGSLFALKTTDINSAARIYVDKREIAVLGFPSTVTPVNTYKDSLPIVGAPTTIVSNVTSSEKPQYIVFQLDNLRDTHELILHVSDYDSYRSGIIGPIYFGPQITLFELASHAQFSDTVALTSVFLLAILFLILLFLKIHVINYRYLLFISLSLLIHLGFTNEKLLYSAWPLNDIIPTSYLYCATFSTLGAFLWLFLCSFQPQKPGKELLKLGIAWFGAVQTISILTIHLIWIQRIITYISFAYLAMILVIGMIRLIPALASHNFEALCISSGLASLGLFFCNKYLYSTGAIYLSDYISYNLTMSICFVVSQMLYVALQVGRIYIGNQHLAQQMIVNDKMKNELMEISSHELRTPLYGIINVTEAVINDIQSNKFHTCTHDLNIVLSLAQRMRTIANDMYTSITDSANYRMILRPVSLQTEVSTIFEMYRYTIPNNRIAFINRIAPNAIYVLADEGRLWQILNNLVGNAVKYTPSGHVTVLSVREGNRIKVSVTDTGIGINFEDFEQIFENHTRLHQDNSHVPGQGIGLHVVQKLITEMGGTISITQSQPGHGSTFMFILPAVNENELHKWSTENHTASSKTQSLAVTSSMIPANATLLVVDDNTENLNVIARIFEDCNFKIDTAVTGREALKKLADNVYDILILDVFLPDLIGFDISRQLRQRYSPFALPILLLTARNSSSDILTGLMSGANDYVIKPVSSVELRARVFNLIALKQSVSTAIENELAFLNSQIKPHFLYNALNTISSIAFNDGPLASELIDDLSIYLRQCFQVNSQRKLVPYETELEITQAYVRIEQARFGERLQVQFRVEKDLYFQMPVLTIQPLVENSIRHGSQNAPYGIMVQVDMFMKNQEYIIEISDNGKNVDVEKISSVLAGRSEKNWSGIGLHNVDQMMRLYYNRPLEFESNSDGGMRVRMRIPVQQIKRQG